MSATKLQTWRPDKKAKLFFLSNLQVAIPDEVIPDGKAHAFDYNGETFSYVAGIDGEGAFVSVKVISTYRPPARRSRPQLRCIVGGKQ